MSKKRCRDVQTFLRGTGWQNTVAKPLQSGEVPDESQVELQKLDADVSTKYFNALTLATRIVSPGSAFNSQTRCEFFGAQAGYNILNAHNMPPPGAQVMLREDVAAGV